ncbi:hypothetical protein WJM97_13585 [Okeanomitos corallinicola TIOX110]|uniref:Uncharacterized protein n=1 Tax=Okeanomitos corallinicola TIOX110 TaxID=3133117 RepID=A0ABZ2UNR1_9CYAN
MSKIIYDVIQRFEVENGIPRLVSTNIQVIEGGEDLLSLAISMLGKMGFYEKFEEKRTSQYIGYRLKNPGKGAKRYQLVLAQRKDGLDISIDKDYLRPHLTSVSVIEGKMTMTKYNEESSYFYWFRGCQDDIYNVLRILHIAEPTVIFKGSWFQVRDHKYIDDLNKNNSCIPFYSNHLFTYTWQASITSKELLEEFISYFAKILMEQN